MRPAELANLKTTEGLAEIVAEAFARVDLRALLPTIYLAAERLARKFHCPDGFEGDDLVNEAVRALFAGDRRWPTGAGVCASSPPPPPTGGSSRWRRGRSCGRYSGCPERLRPGGKAH